MEMTGGNRQTDGSSVRWMCWTWLRCSLSDFRHHKSACHEACLVFPRILDSYLWLLLSIGYSISRIERSMNGWEACAVWLLSWVQVFLDSECPCGSGVHKVFSHFMHRKEWPKQPARFTSMDFQLYPPVGIMSLTTDDSFGIMPSTQRP